MTEADDRIASIVRWMNDMLCFWCLCGNVACRRARSCKSAPRGCFARFAPLVPDEAFDGVDALLEGKRRGASYDDVRDYAPVPIAALEDWAGRVEESLRGLSGGP